MVVSSAPAAIRLVSAGPLVSQWPLGLFSRSSHLVLEIRNASAIIGALRLANLVRTVGKVVMATGRLVVEIDVDRGGAWTTFAGQRCVFGFQFFGLVHLVEMFFQETDVFAVALDGCVGKVADKGYQADEEINHEIDEHHDENA